MVRKEPGTNVGGDLETGTDPRRCFSPRKHVDFGLVHEASEAWRLFR